MTTRIENLVSVVIPVFNGARFLGPGVDSVIAQSYPNWELLIVDDGSSDEGPGLARAYAGNEERIRYLEHPGHANRGVCSTRNLGVKESRGEYIAFLDADDIWTPEKTQAQLEILKATPEAEIVYGPSVDFAEDIPEKELEVNVTPLAPRGLYRPPELLKRNQPLGDAGAPCPSAILMRYDALARIGGFEESFNRHQIYEDQAFLVKVYSELVAAVEDEPRVRYRLHANSCTSQSEREGRTKRDREFFLQWLERYLRQKNVDDPEIWRAMKRLTLPMRYPKLARMARELRGAARQVLGKTR
jgi:glycosyltransferase involved in cell wall biosynthesis